MKCTATTYLSYDECMHRLKVLPPLPHGERIITCHDVGFRKASPLWRAYFTLAVPNIIGQDVDYSLPYEIRCYPCIPALRRWAAPVRKLREERIRLKRQIYQLKKDIITLNYWRANGYRDDR